MVTDVSAHRAMTKRLLIFFSVSFLVLTALDIGTTWVGVHQRGYREINVFTDTSSIGTMLRPEIIIFLIGGIAVFVGALWKRKDLQASINGGFRIFFEAFWLVRRLPATICIYLPIVIAVGRILPVFSNTMLLLTGWSPIGSALKFLSRVLGWDVFRTNVILYGMIFGAIGIPMTYVIYCVCKFAEPDNALDRVGPKAYSNR